MHIRVLLSKYRSYTPCPACGGARLKLEALLWRLGTKDDADAVMAPAKRFLPVGAQWSREQLEALPGLTVHDLMHAADRPHPRASSIACRCRATLLDEALKLLLDEVRTRLQLPVRRRHRLPDARPPEPHALGRRGAAHQPDDRARHVARQHDVRARRAVDRPAPARHEPHRRGDAPAARRRQHAGRRRARPGGDARRRPPDRHGPGPGRARRPDRLRRHARGDHAAPTR